MAVERGAGASASIADADFEAAGATLGSRADVLQGADAVLAVQGPSPGDLGDIKPGALVVAALNPFGERERVDAYAAVGVEALAMEFMPRITRAQSMDIFSSQAHLAGYQAVIVAASDFRRTFPMMCSTAGPNSVVRA